MPYSENVNVPRKWVECPGDGRQASRWQSLYVTMNRAGEIVMSRLTHETMGAPEAYQLLYDPEREVIGMKASDHTRPNAFMANPRGPRGGRRIYGNRLIRHFGIVIDECVRFHRCQRDRNGILILDLKDTVKASKRKKWR